MNLVYALIGLLLVGTLAFVWFNTADVGVVQIDTATTSLESAGQEQNESEETPTTNTSTNSGPRMDLSGRGLTSVDMSVFSRTELTELDLSNNDLEGALQAEVRHLRNLRVLDLSDNNFTGVPAEVGQLSELHVLDLSNNPITGLPHEISNLKNLEVLDLRGTQYSSQDLDIIKQGLRADVEIKTD